MRKLLFPSLSSADVVTWEYNRILSWVGCCSAAAVQAEGLDCYLAMVKMGLPEHASPGERGPNC